MGKGHNKIPSDFEKGYEEGQRDSIASIWENTVALGFTIPLTIGGVFVANEIAANDSDAEYHTAQPSSESKTSVNEIHVEGTVVTLPRKSRVVKGTISINPLETYGLNKGFTQIRTDFAHMPKVLGFDTPFGFWAYWFGKEKFTNDRAVSPAEIVQIALAKSAEDSTVMQRNIRAIVEDPLFAKKIATSPRVQAMLASAKTDAEKVTLLVELALENDLAGREGGLYRRTLSEMRGVFDQQRTELLGLFGEEAKQTRVLAALGLKQSDAPILARVAERLSFDEIGSIAATELMPGSEKINYTANVDALNTLFSQIGTTTTAFFTTHGENSSATSPWQFINPTLTTVAKLAAAFGIRGIETSNARMLLHNTDPAAKYMQAAYLDKLQNFAVLIRKLKPSTILEILKPENKDFFAQVVGGLHYQPATTLSLLKEYEADKRVSFGDRAAAFSAKLKAEWMKDAEKAEKKKLEKPSKDPGIHFYGYIDRMNNYSAVMRIKVPELAATDPQIRAMINEQDQTPAAGG